MLGVILAAGRGTRMKAFTANRPKAMLPVAGKPIIARIAEQLQTAGLTRILIVTAGSDAHIQPYFAAHPLSIPVDFAVQQTAGGMAHALLQAAPFIDQPFILTACDSIYPDDHYRRLIHLFTAEQAPAALTLMKVPPEVVVRAGIADLVHGRVARVVEKPTLAEAPSDIASLALYAFDLTLLGYLNRITPSRRGELELQDAIQLMIDEHGSLPGLLTPWRWEITSPDDLLSVNLTFLDNPGLTNGLPASAGRVIPPVVVEPGVRLPADVTLGPNVYIEAGASIGAGARLKRAVVLYDGVVAAGQVVEDALVSAATG